MAKQAEAGMRPMKRNEQQNKYTKAAHPLRASDLTPVQALPCRQALWLQIFWQIIIAI